MDVMGRAWRPSTPTPCCCNPDSVSKGGDYRVDAPQTKGVQYIKIPRVVPAIVAKPSSRLTEQIHGTMEHPTLAASKRRDQVPQVIHCHLGFSIASFAGVN